MMFIFTDSIPWDETHHQIKNHLGESFSKHRRSKSKMTVLINFGWLTKFGHWVVLSEETQESYVFPHRSLIIFFVRMPVYFWDLNISPRIVFLECFSKESRLESTQFLAVYILYMYIHIEGFLFLLNDAYFPCKDSRPRKNVGYGGLLGGS